MKKTLSQLSLSKEEEKVKFSGFANNGDSFNSEHPLLLKKIALYYHIGGALGIALWVASASLWLDGQAFNFSGNQGFLNFSLIVIPSLLLYLASLILRRSQENMLQNRWIQQRMQMLTSFEDHKTALISKKTITQTRQPHDASLEAIQNLEHASTNIEERLSSIAAINNDINNRLNRSNQGSYATIESSISSINNHTDQSIERLHDILKRFDTQQEKIEQISDALLALQGKVDDKLSHYSLEISNSVGSQLDNVQSSFEAFKDGFSSRHEDFFATLKNTNLQNDDTLQKFIEQQDSKISNLITHFNNSHEKITRDFESRHDLIYVRLQNILKELIHGTDQLVKRVESRQVQTSEILSDKSEKILSVFSEHENNTVERMNQATTNLSQLNNQIKTYLDTQNIKLEELITKSEEHYENANHRINENLQNTHKDFEKGLMEHSDEIHKNIQTNLSHHSDWLNQLANWLEQQNKQLHQHADEYGHLFESTIGNATKNIRNFGATLEGQLSNIVGASDVAITRLRDAGQAFEHTFTRLDNASALGVERAERLEKSLEKSSSVLESSTQRLISSGDTLLHDLHQQSERLSEAVSFMKQEQRAALDGFVDDAEARLSKLRETINNQGQQISSRLEESFDSQAEIINKAIDQNFTQFRRISDHIGQSLVETSSQMIEKLVFQGTEIEKSMTGLISRLVQSSRSLDEGIGNVHNAMESSDSRINDLKTLAQDQLGYFETLISRIQKSSQRVKDNIATDQHEIIRILGETERRAVSSSQEIATHSDSVSKRATEAASRLENIQSQMQQHLDLLARISQQAQGHVGTMDEQIQGQMHALNAALSEQGEHIQAAFTPSLKNISEISKIISRQSKDMRDQFGQSLEDIGNAEDSFRKQTLEMHSLFSAATSHLDKAQNRLLQSTDDIKLVTQNLEQRSEKVENIILNQTRLVEKSALNFEQRLNHLTDHISSRLDSLQEAGKAFDKDFSSTGTNFSNTARELQSILENTFYQLDKSNTLYEEGMQRLTRQLSQAQNMLENHQNHMGNNENAMIHLNAQTSDLAGTLQSRFDSLNFQFEKIAEKITRNVARIDGVFEDQRRGVGSVSTKLEGIRDDLQHQCREISRVSGKALDIFSNLPTTIAHQGNALISQAVDIRDDTEKLMIQIKGDFERLQLQSKNTRGKISSLDNMTAVAPDFMNDLQNIVEELHISSRVLFESLFGKSNSHAKKFSLGTKNIYTRDLLKNCSTDFLSELSKKFHKDDFLRESVLEYQKRFEDLINKAREHRAENDALPNAFISSDIGGLYLVLARVSGCDPVSFDKPH